MSAVESDRLLVWIDPSHRPSFRPSALVRSVLRKKTVSLTITRGRVFSLIKLRYEKMKSSANEGVYPLHRSKIIHLVRHAQGIHNVAGEKDHSAYMSETLFDEQLTPLGWQQVDNLRKHVHASGLSKNIELVVVSPLLRTLQTAVGAFGGESCADVNNSVPLMAENTGSSNRPAISSENCPPFIAVELCREHFGVHPCDRRSLTEYKPMFPAVDFSLIENDGDVLWTSDTREKNEDVAARGMKFMKWLLTREEKEIAVVTHSGFLFHTLGAYGDDCLPTLKKEMSKHFINCELRSVVIVDRRIQHLKNRLSWENS